MRSAKHHNQTGSAVEYLEWNGRLAISKLKGASTASEPVSPALRQVWASDGPTFRAPVPLSAGSGNVDDRWGVVAWPLLLISKLVVAAGTPVSQVT